MLDLSTENPLIPQSSEGSVFDIAVRGELSPRTEFAPTFLWTQEEGFIPNPDYPAATSAPQPAPEVNNTPNFNPRDLQWAYPERIIDFQIIDGSGQIISPDGIIGRSSPWPGALEFRDGGSGYVTACVVLRLDARVQQNLSKYKTPAKLAGVFVFWA